MMYGAFVLDTEVIGQIRLPVPHSYTVISAEPGTQTRSMRARHLVMSLLVVVGIPKSLFSSLAQTGSVNLRFPFAH